MSTLAPERLLQDQPHDRSAERATVTPPVIPGPEGAYKPIELDPLAMTHEFQPASGTYTSPSVEAYQRKHGRDYAVLPEKPEEPEIVYAEPADPFEEETLDLSYFPGQHGPENMDIMIKNGWTGDSPAIDYTAKGLPLIAPDELGPQYHQGFPGRQERVVGAAALRGIRQAMPHLAAGGPLFRERVAVGTGQEAHPVRADGAIPRVNVNHITFQSGTAEEAYTARHAAQPEAADSEQPKAA